MTRVLLATEGPVDEVVVRAVCAHALGCAVEDIDPKKFPARGIAQVLRLLPDTVRAAHFGYYDLLIVHGDADDSPDHDGHAVFTESCRTCQMAQRVETTLAEIPPRPGTRSLAWVLAVPRESTDAWLLWGRDDGDPAVSEAVRRHEAKIRVFGKEKHGHTTKAEALVPHLLKRLAAGEKPPASLARFLDALVGHRVL